MVKWCVWRKHALFAVAAFMVIVASVFLAPKIWGRLSITSTQTSQLGPSFHYSRDDRCNLQSYDSQALQTARLALASAPKRMKYLYGDSVVADARDLRLYGLEHVGVGVSGQVIYCALADIDMLLAAEPSEVILYLGGNDADGQSWYGPDDALIYYRTLVERLQQIGTEVAVHGIHRGIHSRRNAAYVSELNDGLALLSAELGTRYLPPVSWLSFSPTDGEAYGENIVNEWTYDGEHLNGRAYHRWFGELSLAMDPREQTPSEF